MCSCAVFPLWEILLPALAMIVFVILWVFPRIVAVLVALTAKLVRKLLRIEDKPFRANAGRMQVHYSDEAWADINLRASVRDVELPAEISSEEESECVTSLIRVKS